MIISTGRRYIFVHIPKTGGTSLARALEARAMADDILIGDTPKAQKRKSRLKALNPAGRLWKHATLADIDGVVTPQQMNEMLIVTIVRNPWDRMVSYYHWLRDQRFDHPAVQIAAATEFAEFAQHPHTRSTLSNWPYSRYVTDASGQERPALYLRLEHLAADMAPLSAHLGFALEVPHDNRSRRSRRYQDYYTDTLRDLVGQLCATDIARFGYQFEG